MASMCAGRVWHLSKASPMVFRLASFPWASLMSTLEILGWPVRMRVHFGLKERPSKFGLEKMPVLASPGVRHQNEATLNLAWPIYLQREKLSRGKKLQNRVRKQLKWDRTFKSTNIHQDSLIVTWCSDIRELVTILLWIGHVNPRDPQTGMHTLPIIRGSLYIATVINTHYWDIIYWWSEGQSFGCGLVVNSVLVIITLCN
jgi:hypothetical protein